MRVPYIVDVEASGFGPEGFPIEIGCVTSSGERLCALIQPLPHWTHWSDEAESVHGISRDTLEKYGRAARDVCELLNTNLRGRTLYSDGWVVDKPWIERLFHETRQPMNFFVSPIELILTEEQMERWSTTRDTVIRDSGIQRHRASNDAWVIQETFMRSRGETNQAKKQIS